MNNQNKQPSEKDSVIVSEDQKPSVNSQFSDPKKRMKKILAILNNKNEKIEKIENNANGIDYNELVPDNDLRYFLLADMTADLIRNHKANQIRSGYEGFMQAVKVGDMLTPYLLMLMAVFILFGRPEWCANMGTYINYSCTKSLDPNNPVEYFIVKVPLLSFKTKTFICLCSMTVITMINLMKIGVTVSSSVHKKSLYLCLVLLMSYYILFFIDVFNVAKPMFMDVFPVLFTIFNLPSLQKIVNKTLNIIVLSKEILIFYSLILLMVAISARALFRGVPDFHDSDGEVYFYYNFESLANSVYTSVVTFFFMDSIYLMATDLFDHYKIYLVYWIVVGLMVKFFIVNLVVGTLSYYYNTLFKTEVDYMKQYPDLCHKLKEEIIRETANYPRLKAMVKKYHVAGFCDRDIADIEEFYRVSTVNRAITWNADNPHSLANVYNEIATSNNYKVAIGLLEFVGILIIIFSIGEDNTSVFGLYIGLFIVNLLLMMDRVIYLISKRYDSDDNWIILDVVVTSIIASFIIFHLLVTNSDYIAEFVMENRGFKKLIGFLFTVKAVRFLTLFLFQPEIKLIFDVFRNSFGFIADIVLIIIMLFFIFGTIGISLFGGGVNTGSFKTFEEKYGDELSPHAVHFNFNDYYHAFYTLSTIMLSDWLESIKVSTISQPPSQLINLFFIIFFFLSQLCFMNILFGFLVGSANSYLQTNALVEFKRKNAAVNSAHPSSGGDDKPGDDKPGDEEARDPKEQVDKSHFSKDLDSYLDLKKKPDGGQDLVSGPGQDQEGNKDYANELLKSQPEFEESIIESSLPKKLVFKPKSKPAEGYDPLEEILKSIRMQNADE